MYLAIPYQAIFNLDKNKHTVAVSEKWPHRREVSLAGNVKARLSAKDRDAIAGMVENVREYLNCFPDIQDKKISISDFELSYDIAKVDSNGNVWAGEKTSCLYLKL